MAEHIVDADEKYFFSFSEEYGDNGSYKCWVCHLQRSSTNIFTANAFLPEDTDNATEETGDK